MKRSEKDGAPPPTLTRRRFIIRSLAGGSALALGGVALACDGDGRPRVDEATLSRIALSERQQATLRAIVERLIPADDDPGAAEAGAHEFIASELSTPYFESSREGVAEALDGLDELARERDALPFAELDAEHRDALLIGLQVNDLEADGWNGERTLEFLLSLTCEGFLGDPVYGGNRDQAGWRLIGFHRCGPQPRPDMIHRRPAEHESLSRVSHRREEFDAIIVGSGAGGGPVAQILSEAGLEVLVLEKGPWYTKRDFVHDEIAMSRRDMFIPSPELDPHVVIEGEGNARRTNDGWTSRCVGGGTVHMSGFFMRLHPEDFRMKTLIGEHSLPGATLADWPISYQDLAPHYRWVEHNIGVSGLYGPGQVGDPLPLPPLQAHPFAELLDEGARSIDVHTFPTPRAVLSRSYGGRPACTYCGFCGSYGCENDSKSTALSTFLPKAIATGNCQIRPGCQAREVLLDGNGRARGVRYLDKDGGEHEVRGRLVVLACSAIETARLLLLSDGGDHPRGLANSSGLVGRNLLMSTFAGGEAWLARGHANTDQLRAIQESHQPFLQRSSQSYYWMPRAGLPHPKGGTIVFLVPHPNPIHAAEHIAKSSRRLSWGEGFKDRLRTYHHGGRVVEFEVFAEFLPTDGTHVSLDDRIRDQHGVPSARITLRRHEADRAVARYLVDRGLEVLEAAGCTHPRGVSIGRATQILQGGTCRFGTDPDEAVLNADCQTFDVPNLYVTDGSFMPTSGSVPITLTIMANASRVARSIVERIRRGEHS